MIRINSSFENPRYNLIKESNRINPIQPIQKTNNKKKEEKSYQKVLRKTNDGFNKILEEKKNK